MRIAAPMCLLVAALAWPAYSQEKPVKVLRGRLVIVSQQKGTIGLQKVAIKILETGNNGLTDDDGVFRIELAVPMKAGQEVTLTHDKKGYAIHQPLFGKLLLPRDERLVEVRMLPLGSKLFWTDDRLEMWIEQVANDAAKKLQPNGEPIRTDLGEHIRKLGREYGFTDAEVRREIRSWIESAKKRKSGSRALALANFAEENFDLAAKMALKWAEDVDREAARAYSLAGDAFGCGPKPQYGAAITAYEKALIRVERSREETQWWDISFKLAGAGVEFGASAEPQQAGPALRRAVVTYRELLKATDRKTQMQRWAMTHNNLGVGLRKQARLAKGKEAAPLLAQAVAAYHAALEVYTKNSAPRHWAKVQYNLGTALSEQADLAEGKTAARLLAQAV
ncbi:MAG TPA: hypothetical protein VMF69_27415, partial [Gemmataceae bacterium]|nr:hypothetical protein [Gemmataceae bacterium]